MTTMPIGIGLVLAVASLASGCGGGGSSDTPVPAPSPTPNPTPAPSPAPAPTAMEVARFFAQASVGETAEEISRVQSLSLEGWLDQQFAMRIETTHYDWLISKGYNDLVLYRNNTQGIDETLWRRLITASDSLRMRVALALSEIFVVGVDGLTNSFRQFAAAHYMDILERNAFGTYRQLLEDVSLSPAMGVYLSHRGNNKANSATGQLPDENYAREVMQLFSIGLYELNPDGSLRLGSNGKPIETYDQSDVSQLARVFTGWDFDGTDSNTPDRYRKPMVNIASRYETGAKTFLNVSIPAGQSATQSLAAALDALLNHANTGPFIAKQLIQRLVTSNPSAAYVGRVAAVFNSTKASGGDMKAVIRAILLDTEARDAAQTAVSTFGKLREPMLKFVQWARAFQSSSPTGNWKIGNTSDPANALGQSPLRSSSVFNFFRPGYVPPGTALGAQGLLAPELQIANESSVIGYVNYMQRNIDNTRTEIKADYSLWQGYASNAQDLLDRLNLVLAAGQLTSTTLTRIKTAIETIAVTTAAGQLNRLYAAILLVMASPEYQVQK